MSEPRRLSASRVSSMNTCSMKFYMSDILKVPEKTWPRTIIGSLVHAVLECLSAPRHRHHYDQIIASGTVYSSKPVARQIARWKTRHNIADDLIADVDAMVILVLTKTNFLDVGATEIFAPEHEFILTLSGGGLIKGYIDRLARHGDKFIIWDYKSQKTRFTKEELRGNYQAMVYQMYIMKKFGCHADVNFVMLRHPPTTRTPDKHIQSFPAATKEQLDGFEQYLNHMYDVLKGFSLEDAHSNYHTEGGFCRNVCSYFRPSDYLSIKDKETGALIGNYRLDAAPHLKDNWVVETLHCDGCPKFN